MLREESIELDNLPKHHDNKERQRAPDRMSVIAVEPVQATPRFRRELKKATFELFLARVDFENAFPSVSPQLQELADHHSQPDSAAIANHNIEDPVIPPAFLKWNSYS